MSTKLWSGRFKKSLNQTVEKFNASISFDKRLFEHDIEGSIAHTSMLKKQELISQEEATVIQKGLLEIKQEIKNGTAQLNIAMEDIHMNIETLLKQKIGPIADKLHTARSRNDQVALDTKLFTKKESQEILKLLKNLCQSLKQKAAKHKNTLMPSFTHLQKAQVTTFGYHLQAYISMFKRDIKRLQNCLENLDECPLGAGACSGTTLPINRKFTAKTLGFSRPTNNTLDTVSDRDFVMEFIATCSIVMVHLSRISEELILWSSDLVKFIKLDDAFSTGSSLMPNKKNPDIPELIRGKSGRVFGNLITLLTVMKGLPLAYNRDMQEDKEPLFDTVDTTKNCLEIMAIFITSIKVNKATMAASLNNSNVLATDLVDYLIMQNLPFRKAHEIVGKIVAYSLQNDIPIEKIPLQTLKRYSPEIESNVYEIFCYKNAIKSRGM